MQRMFEPFHFLGQIKSLQHLLSKTDFLISIRTISSKQVLAKLKYFFPTIIYLLTSIIVELLERFVKQCHLRVDRPTVVERSKSSNNLDRG